MKYLRGRCLSALFYMWASIPGHALELLYRSETYISNGLPLTSYWAAHPLNPVQSQKIWGVSDNMYRAQQPLADTNFDYFLERRKQSVLASNQTSMTLAAIDRIPSNLETSNYSLSADAKTYYYDALGLNYHGNIDFAGLAFTLSPKVINLYNFKHWIGDGNLQVGNNSGLLTGKLDRYSMNSFGFDPKPQLLRTHTGLGMDIEIQKSIGQHHINLIVLNAFSNIFVENHFYSNRLYQVKTVNNELAFSDTPSLTGFYGQTTQNFQLPRIFQFRVETNTELQGFSPMLGAFAHNRMVSPWVGLKYQTVFATLKFQTSDGTNFHINSELKNVLHKDLSIAFSMYLGQFRQRELLISQITYKF